MVVLSQFSRTVAPLPSKAPALIALMKNDPSWTRAVVLSSTDDVYWESSRILQKQLSSAGIQVVQPRPFEPGLFLPETLKEIKGTGYRYELSVTFFCSVCHVDV